MSSLRLQHGLAAGELDELAGREGFDLGDDFVLGEGLPPVKVYSESHQAQRRLQPARRTKMQGRPAKLDSP